MKARSVYYYLFSKFFVYQEKIEIYLEIIKILRILDENPLDNLCKESTTRLLKKLDPVSNILLIEEFNEIFYNPGSITIRTTASYYDEGVEAGKKRVEAQQFLAKTKIRRNEESFTEHEDSFPFLVTILAELNELIINGEEAYKSTQHCLFEKILNIFVDDFSKNVYEHEKADLFKDVIILLKTFIKFERIYLNIPKPKPREIISKNNTCEYISDEEAQRRAKNKLLKSDSTEDKCSLDLAYDVEDDI
jgi:TorA maturation chaperone TorD